MPISKISCANETATAHVAAEIAARSRPGDIFLLEGDLGAGKTSFARAFIRSLYGDQDLTVPSPTFTLVQTYPTPKAEIWHFDLYRLKEPDEIFELDWENAVSGRHILLVEWPERLGGHRPQDAITIRLDSEQGKNREARMITIERDMA